MKDPEKRRRQLEADLATREGLLEAGHWPSGLEVSPAERVTLERTCARIRAALAELVA